VLGHNHDHPGLLWPTMRWFWLDVRDWWQCDYMPIWRRTVHSLDRGPSSTEGACQNFECKWLRPGARWRHYPGPLWTSHVDGAVWSSRTPNSEVSMALWATASCVSWCQAREDHKLEDFIMESHDSFTMKGDNYRWTDSLPSHRHPSDLAAPLQTPFDQAG
jgi:hypothetical protein